MPRASVGRAVYWTFKAMGHASIAILDGGYQAWQKAGYPVETKPVQPVAAIYEAKAVPSLRAKLDDVLAAKEKNVTLVDSRPETFFSGQEKHRRSRAAGISPARSTCRITPRSARISG